jgi:hypothetical protein
MNRGNRKNTAENFIIKCVTGVGKATNTSAIKAGYPAKFENGTLGKWVDKFLNLLEKEN